MAKRRTGRRVVAYARVSTDQQAERGISLEAQRARLEALATLHEWGDVEHVADAGESAGTLERAGLRRVLAAVEAGDVAVVAVCKLDRLTRSVADLAHLLQLFERHGVQLVSVAESLDTGTAAGRLVLNVMASVSQWEREAIGERTADAMRHLRAVGRRVGAVPYGYRLAGDGRTLVVDAGERRVAARLAAWRSEGLTLAACAARANTRKLQRRDGRAWNINAVARYLAATGEADVAVAV